MHLIKNYQALGTVCNIEIFNNLTTNQGSFIKDRVIKEIIEFENKYSRFKLNSLISILNREKLLKNPPKELIDIIKLSQNYEQITKGVFDIKIAHILGNRGYGFPNIQNNEFTNGKINLQNLDIYLEGDFEIDLGGIGKSYLINKIKNIILEEYKIEYFLINFGGDIYVTSDNGEPIEIYLENPINTEEILGSAFLKNQAVCGSSPYKRTWVDNNQKIRTHIISNSNSQVEYSSFVIADSVIDSDVFATCFCINPHLEITQPDIGYIIIDSRGQIFKTK